MKQDTDCKACGNSKAWDDAPIQICRACAIWVATFVAEERDRYFDRIDMSVIASPTDTPTQVYYLQWGDRIKIGASICPAKRALALSLDPANIVATETGGYPREVQRHRQFAHLRLEGEWFAAGDELLAHIETLAVA